MDHLDAEASGFPGQRVKKGNSPFDGWARRKVAPPAAVTPSSSAVSNVIGKKRGGEPMERDTGRKVSRTEGESFTST